MPSKPPVPPASLQHEIGKRQPFDFPEQEAHLNILRTAGCLAMAFERLFRAHGLSEATYNALRILRGHTEHTSGSRSICDGKHDRAAALPAGGRDGVPSQTIGEQLIAQVPDVTRLVDRLVERGLAERHRIDQDRRVVLVRITKAGLDLLAKLDGPVRELHLAQLGHMSRRDLQQLSQLLVKARAKIGRESQG